MLEIVSQIVIYLLLATLLGFIIGYRFGKGTCSQDTCKESIEVSSDNSSAEGEVLSQPTLLKEAREGSRDNLTRIKGIGIKIEEKLNSIGIYHFDQIASWTDENILWVDKNISFPGRVKREDWVTQAKILADGEETDFSKRVDNGEVTSSKSS